MYNLRKLASLGGIIFLAVAILAGCERPDPQEVAVLVPTLPPLLPPTAVPLPTQPPVQVYVVIAQPTVRAEQPVVDGQLVQVVTATPVMAGQATAIPPTPTAQASAVATALPDNYFLGWAWSDSLMESHNLVTVDMGGIILRDRPSQDGRTVGIVMGFADVFVVGKGRCGYSPIIVHATNMLSRTTPHLEVLSPEPAPTEYPPFFPTPMPQGIATTGWAFTDELTILGQTAISGPLGVNLRSDPCWGGINLGFIPAGSDLIVLGLPSDDYTPVRVNNDVLQIPFDDLIIATIKAEVAVNRLPPNSEAEATPSESEPTLTPTGTAPAPTATATETPSPEPSPTVTPSATSEPLES
jgi:hypothetical protein